MPAGHGEDDQPCKPNILMLLSVALIVNGINGLIWVAVLIAKHLRASL